MKSSFLLERRKKLGISQSDIASKLGYSTQMVSNWESGKSVPGIQIWSKYASILQLDLHGFIFDEATKQNDYCETLPFDGEKFSKNIKRLRIESQLTQIELGEKLSISNKTLSYIENNDSSLDGNQFIKLMEIFDCTCDELYFVVKKDNHQPIKTKKKKRLVTIPIVAFVVVGSVATVTSVTLINKNKSPIGEVGLYRSDDIHHWKLDGNGNQIEIADHVFDSYVSKNPTCVESGEKTKICLVCNHVVKETIPPKGHVASGGWHFDEEFHYHICSVDNVSFDKALHTFGEGIMKGDKIIYTCQDCHYAKTKQIDDYTENDKSLYFGLYPQSHVSDSQTINKLNQLTETDENGYYRYEDKYYCKQSAKKCYASNHSFEKFNDNEFFIDGESYWFAVEPIKWNVLEKTDDYYLLLSNSLIDVGQYSNGLNNYKDSSIRSWLNNQFVSKAFFQDYSRLITSEVNNSITSTNYGDNVYLCENTFDKVYLPSVKDITSKSYGFNFASSQICYLTDYARINQAWIEADFRSSYYTRTPGNSNSNTILLVSYTGGIFDGGIYSDLNFGIRPIIKVSR